jgi:hypothetical protein
VRYFVGTSEEASRETLRPQENNTPAGPFEPNGQFDMVFIDAMHDYQSVKDDITYWLPHVRYGGIIVFHDYGGFPGVTQAFHEFFGPPPNLCCSLAWIQK